MPTPVDVAGRFVGLSGPTPWDSVTWSCICLQEGESVLFSLSFPSHSDPDELRFSALADS